MKANPHISLLVPCFNAEKYVDSFLDNVSKLTQPFDEVIFYDDASTDNTLQIIQSKGYRIIAGETNNGPGYARNRLAENATGDYIHFHDIDDEFNPQFIDLIKEKIAAKNPDIIIGNADWIDSTTRQTVISWQYNEAEINPDPLAYFISHPLGIINTVYRRHIFLMVNGFNEQLHCWEDTDLHTRMAESGAKFSIVNEVLAYSIRHNNGISKNQEWCWECRMKYLEIYKQHFDKKYLPLLGKEFEKTANSLVYYNNFSAAVKSFSNSRACGCNAPDVNNPLFKALRGISPLFAFLLRGLIIKLT